MILATLNRNVEVSKRIIREAVKGVPRERTCPCGHALKNAVVTPSDRIPAETKKKLDLLLGKYL
jgi:5'-methylthioadenosine phosphorylase